ncbi:uncharacterized protein LOC117100807 [Anneissia japonica]|uniref:uncharacterized protein LOC117100807 n=1 Tax=Anneissia japonica TaxID=1529436 RepID=UPI0014255B7D|nr:uncharacterized protein LOC117100807 [Anneissia japonica]
MARRDAEFRLKVAEDSLSRLDSALQQSRDSRPPCLSPNKVSKQNELDSTINQSVSTLKKFFEEIAEEAKIDQDKPIIMKNALHARKSFIRKTKSFKYRKERSMSMLSSRQSFTLGRCNTFSLSSSTERINNGCKQANTLPPGTMGFGDYVWDEEDGLGKPPVFNSSMFFMHKTVAKPDHSSVHEADVDSASKEGGQEQDTTPSSIKEAEVNEKNIIEKEVTELYTSIDKWRVKNAAENKEQKPVVKEKPDKPAARPTPAPRSSPPQARPRLMLSPPPKGRKINPAQRKIPTLITNNYSSSSSEDESSSLDNERDSSGSDSTATDGTLSGNELTFPSSPTFSPKPFSPTTNTTRSVSPLSPLKRNRRLIGAAAGWKKQDTSQPRVGTTSTAEFMEKYAKIFKNPKKNVEEQEKNTVCYDTAL